MLGSGTMARVIKGPGRPLNSHGIQYISQMPNYPTRLPREPRRLIPYLGKTNRSLRWFNVHLITTSESSDRATNWAPVAQLTMNVKNLATPHLPTHRDTKRHNNYYPAQHLIFPRWAHSLDSKPLKG
jgi:hypothetical protein